MGITVPGSPALITGRNTHLAWGLTFSYMDMLDYRIERCRNGKFYREDGWKPFTVRVEEIKVKKKDPRCGSWSMRMKMDCWKAIRR